MEGQGKGKSFLYYHTNTNNLTKMIKLEEEQGEETWEITKNQFFEFIYIYYLTSV